MEQGRKGISNYFFAFFLTIGVLLMIFGKGTEKTFGELLIPVAILIVSIQGNVLQAARKRPGQERWRFLARLLTFPALSALVVLVFPAFRGERLSWLKFVIPLVFVAVFINEIIRWLIQL